MRIAVTTCNGRISPVFGVAKEVLLVDFEDEQETYRELRALNGDPPTRRVERLAELDVDRLICGGITASQRQMLLAVGIQVIDQAVGTVDQALQENVSDGLTTGRRHQVVWSGP